MMTLMFYAIIVCGIFVNVKAIDFSNCGSDYDIKEVDIEGCSKLPCPFEIGGSYGINITIKPTYESDSLTQEAYVILYDVHMNLSVTPGNPCASLSCPVQISDGTKFSGVIYISRNFVPAKAELWWKMKADSDRLAVCIKTSVLLQRRKIHSVF